MGYKEIQYDGAIIRIENATGKGEQLVGSKKINISPEMLKTSLDPIMKFGKAVVDEAIDLAPNEVSLSFGLDIGFENGNLCWGIAKGSMNTHLNVTMTWKE